MDKNTYKQSVKIQKRKGKTGLCCYVCGEDDPIVIEGIEMHHIDGRSNSDIVIPLCKNCHTKITDEQNALSPKDRSEKASLIKKRGFQLINHGALLKLLGEEQSRLGNELVET